ncbi:MAG: PAS domain-containing protein [Sulfurimonas sp.]|nr:PAS domain-containing protein [Sulfurimonas sp.]
MEKVTPIDKEYIYEGDVIISQTDINGIITYANRAFAEASNYEIDELVGKSQNIIRHPDMPKAIFAKMWETISGGQAWNGLVKNLRKDGMYYWVETEIIPVRNSDETQITGYIAVRKEASRKNIKEAQETYSKMLEIQE